MPALFLSDKGLAQSLGDVQKLVTGFQNLAKEENLRRVREGKRNEFTPTNLTPPPVQPTYWDPTPNTTQNPPDNHTREKDSTSETSDDSEDLDMGPIQSLTAQQLAWTMTLRLPS